MVNWNGFLKANKAMLLTLPGAALWSLPIGIAGWGWLQRYVPTTPLPSSMVGYAICLGFVLVPGAAACSTIATRLWFDNRDGYNRGVAISMALFNYFTAAIAGMITVWIAIASLVGLAN
jgi:hypothetical protein